MKCKLNVAVMIIAMCLITTATHAQRLNLVLRFRVPFPFNIENTTFPAGEYEVTQPGQFTLAVRNVENQASVFAPVEPAASANKANGRARTVFHRYGGEYFLAAISDVSWQSSYDFWRSNKEKELARNSPTRQPEVVSVLSKPSPVTADVGRK